MILLQWVIKYARLRGKPLYLCFIDLSKAYDTVDRGRLWGVLVSELGIPADIVRQLQRLYEDLAAKLADAPDQGAIPIRVGLKQGCPCSPMLFSLYFDRVETWVREALGTEGLRGGDDFVRLLSLYLVILLFADDVVLLAWS